MRAHGKHGVCGKCQAKHGVARAKALAAGVAPEKLHRSVVAWEGPSVFTGRPVRVVLTAIDGVTANDKTGPMVQASVIQADGNPSRHRGTERERDVCGDCPASKIAGGDWCYAVTMAWMLGQHAHTYPVVTLDQAGDLVRGKEVRVTAYGDPAAVPFDVWAQLLAGATAVTGYTHAWRTCDPRFRTIAMASTEACDATVEAQAKGWRAFRTLEKDGRLLPSEVLCPNVTHGRTCVECGLCSGTAIKAKSVGMPVHGAHAGRFASYAEAQRAAPSPDERRRCACDPWCGRYLRPSNTTGYSGYCTPPRVTVSGDRSGGKDRRVRVQATKATGPEKPAWPVVLAGFRQRLGTGDYDLARLLEVRNAVEAEIRKRLEAAVGGKAA